MISAERYAAMLPCPCCGSRQIQVCTDYNNQAKDWCKCRECGCSALWSAWQKRATPIITDEQIIEMAHAYSGMAAPAIADHCFMDKDLITFVRAILK